MPINVNWDGDCRQHILINTQGLWTWDHLWTALRREAYQMIDSVNHPVAIFMLNHEHASRAMPPGFLTQAAALHRVRHPLTAITVFVNPDPSALARSLYNIADRAFPENAGLYTIAKTLEEARHKANEAFSTFNLATVE